MKPPLELVRPTLLNILAIVCYCLAILFHIIAYASNGWSSLILDGVRWDMGLWEGCRDLDDGTRFCSKNAFESDVFLTGMSSDWHIGSRIMMTLALILLFVLEFALLGYACIQKLQKYRSKLVGFIIGVSLSAGIITAVATRLYASDLADISRTMDGSAERGWSVAMAITSSVLTFLPGLFICFNDCRESAFCLFLTAIMYGSEVGKVEESYLKGTFALIILSMLLCIALPVLIFFDKKRRYPSENVYIETKPKARSAGTIPVSSGRISGGRLNSDSVDGNDIKPVGTIETQSSNLRRSVSSLSEAETYRKFAYFEENMNINPSTQSIGSATSINTRSEAFTQVSYLTDNASAESQI